jgi:hypothetical protein
MTDREWVFHIARWRVRLYVGSSAHSERRVRTWRSDLGTRGVYVVPWKLDAHNGQVFGAQYRRADQVKP